MHSGCLCPMHCHKPEGPAWPHRWLSLAALCELEEQGWTSSVSWELAPAQRFPQDLQGQGSWPDQVFYLGSHPYTQGLTEEDPTQAGLLPIYKLGGTWPFYPTPSPPRHQ